MGIGMLYYNMRNKKPSAKCKRCGLRYTIDYAECPHCTGLSEQELVELKRVIRAGRIASRQLGKKLLLTAVALIVALLFVTK
ncbi:hypothetical protein A3197_09375 [Candidatus Thiodiazotropha endoloripes]|nr:hypothetical protein A3197_09375 [Candidatus Thiodiazotropha endoloripes]